MIAPSELFDARININGAIAKIGDEVVYSRLIPYMTARPILMACDENGIKIASENGNMHYVNFVVSDVWEYVTSYKFVDFSQHDMDAEKIYTPNPTPEDMSFIQKLLPDDLYSLVTVDATGCIGQVMHKDATKGKAVEELARIWGIPRSEIVAFGDDFNDIDMLAFAGIGVAMENAVGEAIAAADFVCSSNDEDGLAEWIKTRIFGESA